MDALLTVEETARILHVGIATVRRYIREGLLPGAKIGRRYVVRPSDVERLLESRRLRADRPTGWQPREVGGVDDIATLIERAEQLRTAPHGGRWGAVVKANMLAAAHNLKTMPKEYWAKYPDEYALHVETLQQGVRFIERMKREAETANRANPERLQP